MTFGLVCGVTVKMTMNRVHDPEPDVSGREVAQDQQSLSVTFLYCFFGPVIYQALLLISMQLAQPFKSDYTCIPLDRLLHELEIDMCNARDLVEDVPFEKAAFKTPPQ